jgi:hypothetical protein
MHSWQHFSLWTFFAYRYNWLYLLLMGGIAGIFSSGNK